VVSVRFAAYIHQKTIPSEAFVRFVLGIILFLCSLFICLSSYAATTPELSQSKLELVQISCLALDGSGLQINVGRMHGLLGRSIEAISRKNFRPQDYQRVTVQFESEENGVRSFRNHPFYLTIATSTPNQDGSLNGLIHLFGFPYKLNCVALSSF
jgi:hypothetical protein